MNASESNSNITNVSKTLTSLALIQTNILSADYLSTFLPFIATLILKKRYAYIELDIIVKDFKLEYGINIPHAPMKDILSKARNRGLITRVNREKYTPNMPKIHEMAFSKDRHDSNCEVSTFLQGYVDFVKQKHGIDTNSNEACDVFVRFLDKYSHQTISGDYCSGDIELLVSNRDLYLMGEYILSTNKENCSQIDVIRKLTMAYIITVALTFDEPVNSRISEFSNLTIYLDTPIVLSLLGLHTTELENSYIEMFDTFTSVIHPKYMVFRHTVDEISSIIDDCVLWIDHPDYNQARASQVLLCLKRRGFTKVQIQLYSSKLEQRLQEKGIGIDDNDYYRLVDQKRQIDCVALKNRLIEAYSANSYRFDVKINNRAIDNDIHSIENIVKLWGTVSSLSDISPGYLFLTDNNTLAYVARKFISEYWCKNKRYKTPCVTDTYLGTMVWLSTPAEKIENISKLKLLADCQAATTITPYLLASYINTLEKYKQDNTISDSDYLLIRAKIFEDDYLQNSTLNDDSIPPETVIKKALEDIKADIKTAVTSDIQTPLLETIQQKNSLINTLTAENSLKDRQIHDFEQERQQDVLHRTEMENGIEEQAKKTADIIVKTILPIISIAFTFLSLCLQLIPNVKGWEMLIKLVPGCITIILACFTSLSNTNVFGLYGKIINRLRKHYKIKRYKKNL